MGNKQVEQQKEEVGDEDIGEFKKTSDNEDEISASIIQLP